MAGQEVERRREWPDVPELFGRRFADWPRWRRSRPRTSLAMSAYSSTCRSAYGLMCRSGGVLSP